MSRMTLLAGGSCLSRSRAPQFSRELGVEPLTKPGLLFAPAQAFFVQDLEDARLLHGQAQLLFDISCQPLEGPTAVGQTQLAGPGEGRLEHPRFVLAGVARRGSRSRRIF